MQRVPFQGLHPASDTDHVRWAIESMTGKEGIALVIPEGFDAYLRVLHPLKNGQRWAAVAPDYLQPGVEPYPYPFPDAVLHVEGDMGALLVDTLVRVLAAATTSEQQCHYGLWVGWGELHQHSHGPLYARRSWARPVAALRSGRDRRRSERARRRAEAALYAFVEACAVQPWWGGRDMLLFDGPLEAVTTIGSPSPFGEGIRRRGPQWWWPADRRWFVATEIDYPWTYVAGPTGLIDAVAEDSTLEAVPVRHSDRW